MKKLILFFAVTYFSIVTSSAQFSGIEVKLNTAGSIAGTYNYVNGPGIPNDVLKTKLGGISLDVSGYYPLNESLSAKLRIGVRSINASAEDKIYYSDNSSYEYELEGSNFTIQFAPGVVSNVKLDKLTFLFGADLPVGIIGSTKASMSEKDFDASGNLTSNYSEEYTFGGGFSIGLNPTFGMRYKIAGPLVAGIDITSGIQYIGTNGDYSYSSSSGSSSSNESFKINGFGVLPLSGALVLGVNF